MNTLFFLLSTLAEHIVFFATITWLFFVPGFCALYALGVWRDLSPTEKFVGSFGTGAIIADFALIIVNKTLDIPLTRGLLVMLPLLALAPILWKRKHKLFRKKVDVKGFVTAKLTHKARATELPAKLITTTRTQSHTTLIATLLIVLTIVIKGFYLMDTAFPTATDMGHHLYWVNKIVNTQKLQEYKKQELIRNDVTGAYTMSAPEHVPDFIIGEHIPLAVVQIVTGQDILSAEPIFFLFALDILSLLVLFALVLRIFADSPHVHRIALATLFFMGPLYTLSASQAKFISGGVIGNLFGNLLIPLALLFLFRALSERNARFLALFIFSAVGLAFTHHLSVFILAYIIAFTVALFVLFSLKSLPRFVGEWWTLIKSPIVLATIAFMALMFIIHIPSYLNPEAISSATGAPSKDTRTGVALGQLMHTIGEARFAFALIGAALLAYIAGMRLHSTLTHKGIRKLLTVFQHRSHTPFADTDSPAARYGAALLLAWPVAIFAMSTVPQYLGVNIISSRIANYTIIPFALVAAVGLWWLIRAAHTHLTRSLAVTVTCLALLFPLASGMYDNNQSLKTTPNVTEALETYAAARYMVPHVAPDAWVVKDHNYLVADTWMKLFFLRDYSYPLSRSYFARYETNNREECTLDMISGPLSPHAQLCFASLNVRYIVVESSQDAAQFMKTPEMFDRIYSSNHVSVFYRK